MLHDVTDDEEGTSKHTSASVYRVPTSQEEEEYTQRLTKENRTQLSSVQRDTNSNSGIDTHMGRIE